MPGCLVHSVGMAGPSRRLLGHWGLPSERIKVVLGRGGIPGSSFERDLLEKSEPEPSPLPGLRCV